MLKKLLNAYKDIFSSSFKTFLLILLCAVLGAVFVYPLCYFATNNPKLYTISLISIAAVFFIFLIFNKIKKSGLKRFLFYVLKLLIIASSIYGIIAVVLCGKRILIIPIIILSLFLYGFVSYTQKEKL